jgi:single-strand DNA-binding protein
MDLNKVMIIGRLTQQPEKKMLPSGQGVTSFSVATNRNWVDKDGNKQEQVEYHNINAWGKLADICSQYLDKGRQVYIEGRLQTRSWEKDGAKHYRTEIVADNVIMLGSRGDSSAGGTTSGGQVVEEEIRVEDIPF